jgi:hypothetical protein
VQHQAGAWYFHQLQNSNVCSFLLRKVSLANTQRISLSTISIPAFIALVASPSASLSNSYDYAQDVYATYATFGFSLSKKYQVKFGGRLELTQIDGLSNANQSFSNNYQNFIPSIVISRSLKNYQTIKAFT